MAALTRRLVDAALEAGGSFYLPYRLHAQPRSARSGPTRASSEFVAGKRRHDPGLLFRNLLWDRYLAG